MSEVVPEGQPQNDQPNDQPEAKPTPKSAAPKSAEGKPGETPEQTIAGLRAALAKANKEAESSRTKARDEFRTQMREIFGDQPEGSKPEDAVKGLQQQMAAMQHDNLVLRVATDHGITSRDDLALLSKVNDPDAMQVLASRLAPVAPDPAASQPRPPRPDFSQGYSGTPTSQTPQQQFADFMQQALNNR